MAFFDFRPLLPGSGAGSATRTPVESDARRQRVAKPARTNWIGGGIAALIVGLLYALAYVSLDEPLMALLVTVLLLLPAASLLGGSDRPR